MKNPPAFPQQGINATVSDNQPGMDLRDYFAASALVSLSRAWATCEIDDYEKRHVAEDAYGFADAMLAAREASSVDT